MRTDPAVVPHTGDTPRLALRKAEAAHALGVSARTVERLIQARELRAVKLGGVVLIPTSELQRLLAAKLGEADALEPAGSEAAADG